MARDLNRMYVSYFSRTLGLSVYPVCGIHDLLMEDKEIPDISIEEYRQEFIKRTENLMRHAGRKASVDPEIKKTRSIISEYLKEALPVDWSDRKAMEAFCGKTIAVQALLERRLKDRNFRYAADFSEEIAAPICFAYAAHLQMEEARKRGPDQLAEREFEKFLDRIPDDRRTYIERMVEQHGGRNRDTYAEMVLRDMPIVIGSSRQEVERNLKAFDEKYASGNGIEESLKEHTDSCREAILSLDWFDPGQTKTAYDKALSEVKWLNERM